jgi:hypothetical protein
LSLCFCFDDSSSGESEWEHEYGFLQHNAPIDGNRQPPSPDSNDAADAEEEEEEGPDGQEEAAASGGSSFDDSSSGESEWEPEYGFLQHNPPVEGNPVGGYLTVRFPLPVHTNLFVAVTVQWLDPAPDSDDHH